MNISTKFVLPLLIIIIYICTGTAMSNGENIANVTNGLNITITNASNDINVTTPIPTPVITHNISTDPNVTVPIPTPVIAHNISTDPNVTVPIPTPVITPVITTVPSVAIPTPAPVITPVITTVPSVAIPTPAPVITQNITDYNITDENVTQGTTYNIVPTVVDTSEPVHISKQRQSDTQTSAPIVINVVSPNSSNQNSFFGDIYDKIFIAAILGFVGLFYEIIKIRYDHKQKAKLEQINEDTQNKLLEKFERRQEKLLSQHGISDKRQDYSFIKSEEQQEKLLDRPENSDKRQDEPLNKSEKQQEGAEDKNKNT